MIDGPTLDQHTLSDCQVIEDYHMTGYPNTRPMTVDDLIGLVKQLPGVRNRWCGEHDAPYDGANSVICLAAFYMHPEDQRITAECVEAASHLIVPIPEETT